MPWLQSQDAGPLPRLQAPSRGAGGAIWASPSPNTGLDRGSGRGGREAARPRRGLSFPQVGPQLGLSGRSPEPVDLAPRTTAGDKALAGDSAATRGRAGQREGATGPLGTVTPGVVCPHRRRGPGPHAGATPPRQPLTAAHGLHGLFPSAGLRHDRREQLLRVLVLAEGLVLASRCGPRAGRTRWASVRTVDRGQPRLDEAVTVTDPKSTGGRHGAVRATGSRTASRRTLDLHARLVGTPVDVLTGEAELGLRVQWL